MFVRKQDSIKILLGKNIKLNRQKKNLTQAEFADAVSCDVKYIGDVENGWFYPSSELLERIVAFLDVPVSSLFDPLNQIDISSTSESSAQKMNTASKDKSRNR